VSNKFKLKCPGCPHVYVDTLIEGVTKLIHPGYTYGDPSPKLPTARCVACVDYVLFEACQHCCPEVFAECPQCTTGVVGNPTTKPCRCS